MRVFIAAVALLAAMEVQAGGKGGRGGHRHGGSGACGSCGSASGGCASGSCGAGGCSMGGGGCASGFCGMNGCGGGAACATCGPNGSPCPNGQCVLPPSVQSAPQPQPAPASFDSSSEIKVKKNGDVKVKHRSKFHALDLLNSQRAQRGMYGYVEDPALQAAAEACAQFRAANHIQGHVGGQMSDFAFLPAGAQCVATGAGANTPDWGFTACACYEQHRTAGAAGVMGDDGRFYCSLFVGP